MLVLGARCLRRTGTAYAGTLLLVQSRRRQILTLAIETSCDDTSVAILEKRDHHRPSNRSSYSFPSTCHLHFHKKITANNSAHGGVHPIVALASHQENLATLVAKALHSLPNVHSNNGGVSPTPSSTITLHAPGRPAIEKQKPDFVSVTRGPGMRSSLTTGLDTAKGLAVALQVPLLGVNHMQAHALTPRLVSALNDRVENTNLAYEPQPTFPFLSLLVSGGHTLLLNSASLTAHSILATTTDIAIGDCIDKIARLVLPSDITNATTEIMYGRLLEKFAFPKGSDDYNYTAPTTRGEEIARKETRWTWALSPPLAQTRSGLKSRSMQYTFSGLGSAIKRICEINPTMSTPERIDLAREAFRLTFEHLASRVGWALTTLSESGQGQGVKTLVVSGGVASNGYLRTVLRSFLTARGFPHIGLSFPPVELCTDNAAMIAWAGMEMWEGGWESGLGCRALRKWSLDPLAEDGGILGADCWKRREGHVDRVKIN